MKRSPEIEQLVRDLIAALERGDIASIEEATSRDPGAVSIGTDPDEYLRGCDKIIGLLADSTPQGPMGIHQRLSEVHGYEHGDVGWADGTGSFERDGDSVETRVTGVFLREQGKWRGVQIHGSIGVPNDQTFDKVYRRPHTARRG